MATISSTLTLVDDISGKLNTIQGAVDDVRKALNDIGNEQDTVNGFSWSTFLTNAEHAAKQMERYGQRMTLAITGPLVLLGKKMYGNATDYESAFTGVKKTTDATVEEYAQLYADLLNISERTPTGFVQAAGIMEMAGQLGVAKNELTGFTEAYIGLQESTNIQGEEGAADLARFLNVTERTTANVDRVGGVIVGLGNNFATTEAEILAMATRMGATADLAGFTAPEILAFSAALSSVGINAEAGGSAAGKLMKRMQLAAEVGGVAQERLSAIGQEYENGLEFSNALSGMGKAELVGLASDLGMTTDAVQQLADSWLALDQFSEVMGLDQAGFLKSWDEGAAKSMLRFFQGLGNLDPESGNSVLAQLAEMDLTEIRLSNLVAAMAGNSDLFAAALEEAYRQYDLDPAVNAMAEEVGKRYATQESQNAMLGNKLNNTMADFGQNLVEALNPALEIVNNLLEGFNNLSESDQTTLVKTLGAIALIGPGLTIAGNGIEAIVKIARLAGKVKSIEGVFNAITGFVTTTPVGTLMMVAGGIAAIAYAVDSIPSETERIWANLQDIKITVDQDSLNETMAAIQMVREASESLKNPEVSQEYENISAAVSMGYGTNTMYGKALGYEAQKANADIDNMIAEYSGKLRDIESNIANATTDAERQEYFGQYQAVESEMNRQVAERRALYAQKVSDLFNGMASRYPEAAVSFEKTVQNYDLLDTIFRAIDFDWNSYSNQAQAEESWHNLMKSMYSQAFDLGYMDKAGYDRDTFENLYNSGGVNNALWISELYERAQQGLASGVETTSQNPILTAFLQSMIDDDSVMQNLDFSSINGALRGIVDALDFQQALSQADANGNVNDFGEYLVTGVASGIESGTPTATAAMSATSEQVVAGADAILNAATGAGIGSNVAAGVAAGISSGTGAAVAAASALGNTVASALRSALRVHSPSRVTYEIGNYTAGGFINALLDSRRSTEKAVLQIVDTAESAWNTAAWSDIATFAALENDQLLSDAKDAVKISESDIRKIRDLAEREVINHFTTAEVKVEMHNTNEINNDMDVDHIVEVLAVGLSERLEAVAEGVYI